MTSLLTDAHAMHRTRAGQVPTEKCARELVHADDTLRIDSDPDIIEDLMNCIEICGSHYGL
eukprot:2315784-Pyramimonas_sp.AAC.1